MNKSYDEGYKAALNEWPYDLSKANDTAYNAGWIKGKEKLRTWDKSQGWI